MSSHASPHCDPSMWERGQDMHTGPELHPGVSCSSSNWRLSCSSCTTFKEKEERVMGGQEDQHLRAAIGLQRLHKHAGGRAHTYVLTNLRYANPFIIICIASPEVQQIREERKLREKSPLNWISLPYLLELHTSGLLFSQTKRKQETELGERVWRHIQSGQQVLFLNWTVPYMRRCLPDW